MDRTLLLAAAAALIHAAYSTYEHLSRLKALGRPEGALPFDIVVEVLVALVLGILGASAMSSGLKEVLWRTEMRKRSMDQMINPSLTFPSYERGKAQS